MRAAPVLRGSAPRLVVAVALGEQRDRAAGGQDDAAAREGLEVPRHAAPRPGAGRREGRPGRGARGATIGCFQSVLLARKRGRTPANPRMSMGSTRLFTWFAITRRGAARGTRSRPTTSTSRKKIRSTRRARRRAPSRPAAGGQERGPRSARGGQAPPRPRAPRGGPRPRPRTRAARRRRRRTR